MRDEQADRLLPVYGWRVQRLEGSSTWLTVAFDPFTEQPLLRLLTAQERADRLDTVGSVSALPEGDQLELL